MSELTKSQRRKMDDSCEKFCEEQGYDYDVLGFYVDTESDTHYYWNCETPDGVKFKVAFKFQTKEVEIITNN